MSCCDVHKENTKEATPRASLHIFSTCCNLLLQRQIVIVKFAYRNILHPELLWTAINAKIEENKYSALIETALFCLCGNFDMHVTEFL